MTRIGRQSFGGGTLTGVILTLSVATALLSGCPAPEFTAPPSIEVGTGEFSFEPVMDGMDVPIIFGPQGGSHVWLGVRVANMEPRRLHLESSMFQADVGVPVGETVFFDVNLFEGSTGEMETAGLPHQVEPGEVSNTLMRIDVVAVDRGDRMAMGSMELTPIFD